MREKGTNRKFGEGERERRKEKMSEKLQLLSIFHGDQAIGSYWSKRQSLSTQREPRVEYQNQWVSPNSER